MSKEQSTEPDSIQAVAAEDDEALELRLGQNWFAKAGIVGLALGIAFLLTLPYHGLPPVLPSALGYALVAGIFFFSYYWKESFQQVSRYLLGGGLLLLYFTTLRLCYFSESPALSNASLEDGLLLLVVAISFLVAIRRESIYLASISLTLGCLTALLGGNAPFVLSVLTFLSVMTAVLSIRFQWNVLLTLGIGLTLLTHFLWSANNPLLGNTLQFGLSPQQHLLFILIYAIVFASAMMLQGKDVPENAPFILNSFLNGLFAFGVFVISTLVGTNSTIATWNTVASAVFLALSIFFWIRKRSVYATFVYAMVGYAALSVAIVAQFRMPDFFVWLCWQSILVVSTAVWFRSRFIIVANFIIYLVIFIAYLVTAATVSTCERKLWRGSVAERPDPQLATRPSYPEDRVDEERISRQRSSLSSVRIVSLRPSTIRQCFVADPGSVLLCCRQNAQKQKVPLDGAADNVPHDTLRLHHRPHHC